MQLEKKTSADLLVLLPVHGCPCKLGRLEAIVEVALALGVSEKEDLKFDLGMQHNLV